MHITPEDKTYLPPSIPWNEGDIPAICVKVEKAEGVEIKTLTWCVLEDGAKIDRIIVNPESNKETTALERAVKHGHGEVVKLLLKNRAFVDLRNEFNENKSPIHMAVEGRRLSILKLLIEHGANVDAMDKTRSTPLHYAIRSSQISVVTILLSAGADIHAFDEKEISPVALAVDLRDLILLQLLLEYNRLDSAYYFHELARKVNKSDDRRNSMDIKALLIRHGPKLSYIEKSLLVDPPHAIADSFRRRFSRS